MTSTAEPGHPARNVCTRRRNWSADGDAARGEPARGREERRVVSVVRGTEEDRLGGRGDLRESPTARLAHLGVGVGVGDSVALGLGVGLGVGVHAANDQPKRTPPSEPPTPSTA